MNLYVGDLLFAEADGFIGKSISIVTHSPFSHVGMIYNREWIFEAHMVENTRLNPLKDYQGRKFRVLRPRLTNEEKHQLKKLMEEFNGALYSPWDILTNFTFSWLPPATRRNLVAKLGRKKMMICSELVGRLLYTVDPKKFSYLYPYGGLQPADVFVLGVANGMKEIIEPGIKPTEQIDVVEPTV